MRTWPFGYWRLATSQSHRTIRDFCALYLEELSELFTQVVRLAREMGLVKLGTIAVDGTKIKANASRHEVMSYARMQSTKIKRRRRLRRCSTRPTTRTRPRRTSLTWTSLLNWSAGRPDWPL